MRGRDCQFVPRRPRKQGFSAAQSQLLLKAVVENDPELLRASVKNSSLADRSELLCAPLMVAVAKGLAGTVKLLLQEGADPDEPCHPSLHQSLAAHTLEIVAGLKCAPGSRSAKNFAIFTPMQLAALARRPHVFQLLTPALRPGAKQPPCGCWIRQLACSFPSCANDKHNDTAFAMALKRHDQADLDVMHCCHQMSNTVCKATMPHITLSVQLGVQISFYIPNIDSAVSSSKVLKMLQTISTAQPLQSEEQRVIAVESLVLFLKHGMLQLAREFLATSLPVCTREGLSDWSLTLWSMFHQGFSDSTLEPSLTFLQQHFLKQHAHEEWREMLTEVAPDDNAASYFQLAVQAGNQNLCRIMLECGALPWQPVGEHKHGAGKLPITLALEGDNMPMVQLLLQQSTADDFPQTWACIASNSSQVLTALFKSSIRPDAAELADLMSQLGRLGMTPDTSEEDMQQQTALMLACMHGYAAGVQALLGDCVLQSHREVYVQTLAALACMIVMHASLASNV
ncbi:hypothetical protein MMC07_000385 [Pseudocyphellaria aurata]|nr:hypothetical protein [Pseudocyphellaria aurata]